MMKIIKKFKFNNIEVPYFLEEKEVSSFILKLDNYNNIIFIKPKKASNYEEELFLKKHFKKIYKKSINRNSLLDAINLEKKFFYCLGEKIFIDYDLQTETYKGNNQIIKISRDKIIQRIEFFKSNILLNYIKEKQFQLEKEYNMKHSNVFVSKKEKAWATNYVLKNNIFYSLNLSSFSKSTIDYVIIHELCHNVFYNHSKAYWDLVEKKFPSYKKEKEKLKNFIFS